jgi:putative drug exporter of the RND superfamily
MTPAGIARVGAERTAAQAGLKMSSLSDAKVYLGGTAATFEYMADGASNCPKPKCRGASGRR